jgi:translation initiation factor IF-2
LAKAKRVFEVAKELGVTSKAIVEKCKAEGVPDITNHMSVVKIGLVMTIQEWFSVGQASVDTSHTAIETAEKVDLKKARRKVAAKVSPSGSDVDESDDASDDDQNGDDQMQAYVSLDDDDEPQQASSATALMDAPQTSEILETTSVTPTDDQAEPEAEQPVTVADEISARSVTDKAVAKHETPIKEPVEAKPETEGPLMNVPRRPQNVQPAGEQLQKPKGAVLKGPRVVRIEQPEQMQAPRPRRQQGGQGGGGDRQGGGGGGGGYSPSVEPNVPGISRSRGPERGRGAGAPGAGAGAGAGDNRGGDNRGGKRRGQNARRGRSGGDSMPLGPGKISEQDLIELDARLKGAPGYLKQRRRSLKSKSGSSQTLMPVDVGGKVEIAEPITIKTLSAATGIKTAEIVKYLFSQGIMSTINSAIATEAAMEIALDYEIELEVKEQQTAEQSVIEEFENQEVSDKRKRPPVVAVLGHVDHGKTSLLDKIRKADVAAHEDGGITQHVGAYRVTVDGSDGTKKTVVFLDTPGHEAFTSMRARGANITDIVVLVVAADDGVMPQTIESINHAKAAGVTVVVALNKIDMPMATDSNIQKIYGQLAEHGLNPTEWGGETEVIKTSAITGEGVTDLLEVLDYQSELRELQADYGGLARGMVIETEMQEGRGPVARVLVQQGTMKVGDFIVIGRAFGRVRDMTDERGRAITDAGPSTPLELSGIDMVPNAGEHFYTTKTLQSAENVAKQYRDKERQRQLASQTKVTLDNFAETIKAGETNYLRVVLKADVQGSIDVLNKTLTEVGNNEVAVKVIHSGVGGVTESDVLLADASDAIVVGFHVVANAVVRDIADQRKVEIRNYRVIYDLVDEIKAALEGMLKPEVKEEQLGVAEVKQVFKISKVGNIAGCLVNEGVINAKSKIRVVRDGIVVTDNRDIDALRRLKDEAKEVRIGTECGIRIKGYDDLKPGDLLICFKSVSIARKLEG